MAALEKDPKELVRTTVYLRREQRIRLQKLAAEREIGMSDLIRDAIDELLAEADVIPRHELEELLRGELALPEDQLAAILNRL